MDAFDFLRAKARMCRVYRDCAECPADGNCVTGINANSSNQQIEKVVAIVERWAAEHPQETRLSKLLRQYPKAKAEVIKEYYPDSIRRDIMEIRPITLKEASEFISVYHRHHKPTVGCKFCLGLYSGENLVGVAVCGRPVSRYLDDGKTCEINRLCTDGTRNACSMLYGAACRVAKAMGYKKIITYILESENGASLKASNFICDGTAGGTHWTGKRNRGQELPAEMKTRWTREL